MSQSSNELSQELAVLSDVFSDLGERLLGAARQLHSPGAPPDASLVDELASTRRDYETFRDRVKQYALSLRLPDPGDASLDTLQGLTALLDEVAEAEIRQSKGEEVRRRALSVLDRVLALNHTGESGFAPLLDVQDGARATRVTLVECSWAELPAESESIAEGDHPYAHLVSLIEDRDELSDDLWSSHHDSVTGAFGKPLAAAAARSKLVVSGAEAASSDATPSAPAPETRPPASTERPAGGKRNLGKATPSSR